MRRRKIAHLCSWILTIATTKASATAERRTNRNTFASAATSSITPAFQGGFFRYNTKQLYSSSSPTKLASQSNDDNNKNQKVQGMKEPEESSLNFGRQDYWNGMYKEEKEFSWYTGWSDIEPFFSELVPLPPPSSTTSTTNPVKPPPHVLIPGIGNDSSMVQMYDDGYTHMTAFDYAPEGVECVRKLFGSDRLINDDDDNNEIRAGVRLNVADARELPYNDDTYDAILEKGTLDAINLAGGKDKDLGKQYISMAVSEFARVIRKGGIVMSVTAACAPAVESAFESMKTEDGSDVWRVLRDGSFYMTEDGFASNNVDATIFAWEKI